MSVQNQPNPYFPFVRGALAIAAGTAAGALMGPPIGALGGALFTTVEIVTGNLANYFSTEIIEVRSTAAKVTMAFLGIVASFAAGAAALSLAGFSFTATHIAVLFGTSLLVVIAATFIITCGVGAVGLAIAASARR